MQILTSAQPSNLSTVALNSQSPIPLYEQLAQALMRLMECGDWKAGHPLPSEAQLMVQHEVSRVTVRQALAVLRRQGRIESHKGRGSFVTSQRVQHDLNALTGFYDSLRAQGFEPETRLLAFGEDAPARLARDGVPPELPIRLERLYRLDGRAFALVVGHLPAAARTLGRQRAERLTIYQIVEHYVGVRVARADVAIRCQRPSRETAALLGLGPRQPALVMERRSFSRSDQLCEFMRVFIVPEHYEFRQTVTGTLEIAPALRPVVAPARVAAGC